MLLDRRGVRGHTGASGCLRFSLAIVVSCPSVRLRFGLGWKAGWEGMRGTGSIEVDFSVNW